MSPNEIIVPPPMMWAQRSDVLFVTISVECKDIDFKFTDETMCFSGVGTQDNKTYQVTITFLHKINPDKVTNKNTARCIEFIIQKAEIGPYWPSLTTDKKKPHFLKVDFNKWIDEDNADEEDLSGGMGGMGMGGGGGGMGMGMGGGMDNFDFMANMNKFGDKKPDLGNYFDNEEEDSDDEDIPNLE